jgi:hypothetical protein
MGYTGARPAGHPLRVDAAGAAYKRWLEIRTSIFGLCWQKVVPISCRALLFDFESR